MTDDSVEAARLCKNVEDGGPHAGGIISAGTIRRLALSLPIGDATQCTPTPAGIVLRGVTIDGRVDLDHIASSNRGPIIPLEFQGCTFLGGFSGVHSHFSRLSFKGCFFVDDGTVLDPDSQRPLPTIDLSGAKLDRQLDMREVKPKAGHDLLWIRAPGLCVGGGIEWSGCRLRAPSSSPEEGAGRAEAALDLTLAEIRGDLSFDEGSSAEGCLKLRGTQIHGDFWLDSAKLENPGKPALFLQGARIGGFLSMRPRDDSNRDVFRCQGSIDLTGVEVGRSLSVQKAMLEGDLRAPDLTVRDDLFLHACVRGKINLEHVTVGGSLDISDLQIGPPVTSQPSDPKDRSSPKKPIMALVLKDGRIGRALRLAPGDKDAGHRFQASGTVDLTGLTCDTLDDEIGQRWGKSVRLQMNQFIYRRTGWLQEDEEEERRPSHKMLGSWLLAKWAEGHWPFAWLPRIPRLRKDDYWAPWQLRRNWIHQQSKMRKRDPVSIARHAFRERDYHPQPLEQAVRVARAEGREDFATHFEMLKQRIEWGFFNRLVRWWLGFAGIALGTLWLILHQPPRADGSFDWWLFGWTILALGVTLTLMVRASSVHSGLCRLGLNPGPFSQVLTWMIFFLPVLLLIVHTRWWNEPFQFIVAFLIFLTLRFTGVLAHGAMRFGFGYLRRPVRAIVTLIFVFLIGWWGVHAANVRNMLVVNAEPIATVVGTDSHARYPDDHDATGPVELAGSRRELSEEDVAREISCAAVLSEPLYALDVLVPIIDLGEERRCEVRRVAEHREPPRQLRPVVDPNALSIWQMWARVPDLPLNDHRFWWWMKALYAIAGWIIVSLSILTFAQVNKTHAEPPTEHK